MSQPLFSVVILVYRHYEHLNTAVSSVLAQDYDNIELIVSDDGSPNFPGERILDFIEKRKKENIRSVQVRCEPQNVGTVKHLNHVKQCCNGEYIIFLAGDDALYNNRVLSNYVSGFSQAPENCYIAMAQTAMYDEKLQNIMEYYLQKPVQDAIVETAVSSDSLKKMLARFGACLPTTSTCFTKEFFERFGDFDETYKLVEDFPMHVRLANEGWIIHYINFVAIKHRNGGISHGQSDTLSASAKSYYSDLLRMDRSLVLSMLDVLPPDERSYYRRHWTKDILWLDMILHKDDEHTNLWRSLISFVRTIKHSGVQLEKKNVFFFKVFCALSITKGWVAQMCLLEFGLNISQILTGLSWCSFGVFAFLTIMAGIRRVIWWANRFPNEVIALG